MQQYIDIGKIVNTHGIKGEVKVVPLTDDPDRFLELKWVYLGKGTSLQKYNIESVKFFKTFTIIKFVEVQDMNTAEGLKDFFIKIDMENAVKLPKDSYFIFDIIGCKVYEENGSLLGEIKDVLETGSNDVYVVQDENKKEILIPALKSVVREINIQDKKVVVILPEGLIE